MPEKLPTPKTKEARDAICRAIETEAGRLTKRSVQVSYARGRYVLRMTRTAHT